MTLEEGKRKVVALLEGYAGEGEIEVDADIALKMNDFFDIAQKDVAQWQPIVRRAELTLDGTGSMALPADVSRVLRIRREGVRTGKYEVMDGRLLSEAGDTSTLTLDYFATPETITANTDGAHEFEVSEEAANCLPFFVAAQHLLSEPEIDYSAFYNLYLQMRSMLPRSTMTSGSVRQALYRR